MAACLQERRVFFFHMSLLMDFDLPLMLRVLKVSPHKNPEQGVSCFSRRLTTIREEGSEVSFWDVTDIIQRTFAEEFGIRWIEDEFTGSEMKRINELRRTRYESQDWLFRTRSPGSRKVCVERRTPAGLLRVYLTVARGIVEDLLISGDFFSTPEEVARVESALRWTPARRDNVARILEKVMDDGRTIYRLDAATLTGIIAEGIESC